jgi:DNA-directed RNA polymerase specialized sigma24 family protein
LYFPPQDVDPAARALIKHKAKKLVGSYGFTHSDREDLEQELALKAFLASTKFDPARGTAKSFYNRVLTNRANSLARHATSQKRDRRREAPLEGEYIDAPTDDADLRLDVQDALAPLSDADKSIAGLLATDGVAAVADLTGLTRAQVRGARRRIARALAEKDLAPDPQTRQPFSRPTPYVLGNGTSQLQSRRPSGPQGKALAALRPTRGMCPAHAATEEGAPQCPRP